MTESASHNPVGWFEIYVQDMPRAVSFYETVLGCKLESLPMPEGSEEMEMMSFPMHENAPNAGGALVKMENVPSGPGGTLVYFSSADCTTEISRVESAGGKVVKEKESIGQYGFIALGLDPDGNMFGLHSQA